MRVLFPTLICAVFLCSVLLSTAEAARKCGKASWYALKGRTASGARNNPNAMTAAHRRLRFGKTVKVKNMRNGRTVTVRINDRGPFIRGRIIDVSRAAARKLGFLSRGVTRVCITY